MDIVTMMREQDGDDLAHLIDSFENGEFVVQNIVISRAALDEWRALLEECASTLQYHYDHTGIQHDEDLAVLCEETAEYMQKVSE